MAEPIGNDGISSSQPDADTGRKSVFLDGLQNYALGREARPLDPLDGPVKSSYTQSALGLLWKNTGGEIVPGPLLANQAKSLMDRLVPDIQGVNLDAVHPDSILPELEDRVSEWFLEVKGREGEEYIHVGEDPEVGRYERTGPLARVHNSPIGTFKEGLQEGSRMVSRDAYGNLQIKPDEGAKIISLSVELAPDAPITADLCDTDGNTTGEQITANPLLQAEMMSRVDGKDEPDKTTLYRTKEGLVVASPDGSIKCYPEYPPNRISRK